MLEGMQRVASWTLMGALTGVTYSSAGSSLTAEGTCKLGLSRIDPNVRSPQFDKEFMQLCESTWIQTSTVSGAIIGGVVGLVCGVVNEVLRTRVCGVDINFHL